MDGKTKEFIKGNYILLSYYVLIHDDMYIIGFDELGGRDDFSTEMLEWRLGCSGVIDYTGNLLEPPVHTTSNKQTSFHSKKTVRDMTQDSSDSD